MPAVTVPTPRGVELGIPFIMCLYGFNFSEPINVRVTLPDGTDRQQLIPPDPASAGSPGINHTSSEFLTAPPDRLGAYRVTADQASLVATGTFTAQRPYGSIPGIATLSTRIRPGGAMPVVLANFAPGERVAVYLYRPAGTYSQGVVYRRDRLAIASVRVDGQGFADAAVVVHRRGDSYVLGADGVFSPRFDVSSQTDPFSPDFPTYRL